MDNAENVDSQVDRFIGSAFRVQRLASDDKTDLLNFRHLTLNVEPMNP
jgi:hypothetical protein